MLVSKGFHVRTWILLALGLALFATGCANDTIRVRDKNAIVAAGRVVWQAAQPSERTFLGLGTTGVVVEGELSYMAANDRQQIALGSQVALGNTTLAGPAALRSRAKVIDATAIARSGVRVMDLLRVEPFVGVEVTTVDLELSSGGVQESDRTTAGGFLVGLRAGLQPHKLVEFYGLYAAGVLFGGDKENKSSASQKFEVGARLLPLEHVGIFAAYREAVFFQIRDDTASDATLDFRGPILGMELRF